MKVLKLTLLAALMSSSFSFASTIDSSYQRFIQDRESSISSSDKAISAFGYFSDLSKAGFAPKSFKKCLGSLSASIEIQSDPCAPIVPELQARSGGSTGGAD